MENLEKQKCLNGARKSTTQSRLNYFPVSIHVYECLGCWQRVTANEQHFKKGEKVMAISKNTKRTIEKYGKDLALKAISLHKQGEGANTISWYILPPKLQGKTRVADALINAGRELMLES